MQVHRTHNLLLMPRRGLRWKARGCFVHPCFKASREGFATLCDLKWNLFSWMVTRWTTSDVCLQSLWFSRVVLWIFADFSRRTSQPLSWRSEMKTGATSDAFVLTRQMSLPKKKKEVKLSTLRKRQLYIEYKTATVCPWAGYLSRYTDWLWAGRFGDRIPLGGEIFHTCPDRPWGPLSLLYNVCLSFPGVKSGQGVTLTRHPLLVPWSWKGRAIPLLLLWAVRPVQSLSGYTGVTFTFTFF